MKDKFEQIVGKVESGHLEPKEAVDKLLVLFDVSQQRELLIKELKDVDLKYIEDHEDQEWLVDRLIELINCG